MLLWLLLLEVVGLWQWLLLHAGGGGVERRLRTRRRLVAVGRHAALDEACPREHVDVHVAGAQQVLALALGEELLLAAQLGPRPYERIDELDLGEEDALRLHVDRHAVQIVVDEVLQAQVLDRTQTPIVLPVDADLQLTRL